MGIKICGINKKKECQRVAVHRTTSTTAAYLLIARSPHRWTRNEGAKTSSRVLSVREKISERSSPRGRVHHIDWGWGCHWSASPRPFIYYRQWCCRTTRCLRTHLLHIYYLPTTLSRPICSICYKNMLKAFNLRHSLFVINKHYKYS